MLWGAFQNKTGKTYILSDNSNGIDSQKFYLDLDRNLHRKINNTT